jgi:hypothetical protein
MFEFGVYVLCAFLLFVVLLPLMGAIVGIVAYMGLPYLAGVAFACAAHKIFHGSYFDLGAFWILALIWVVLLVYVRQVCKKALELESTWHEGHYLAASTILLMGHPYRKIKKAATA